MYNELRKELTQIFLRHDLLKDYRELLGNLNFQIEEPDERLYGLLATNVAFIISKKIKENGGETISPQRIAEAIASELDKNNFTNTVDGGGFINLTPTDEFVRNYLISEPESLVGEINVDWSSSSMREKIRGSEEALVLLKSISVKSNEFTRDDSLQLLSVIGDVEIDSNAYLRNFGGRENTPWYLRKFEETFKTLPLPKGGLELEALDPISERLLLFRGRFDESVLRGHPDRAVTHLLKLVRDFFSEYNRPTTRAQLLEGKNTAFLFRAQSCGKQVLPILKALKFSCQLPATVL